MTSHGANTSEWFSYDLPKKLALGTKTAEFLYGVGRDRYEKRMDDAYLKQVERRLDAATQGPWTSFVEARDHTSGSRFIRTASEDIELSGATPADQDFTAHARQDVALLIAEVRRLRKLAGLADR